jgi:hypothetical protein
MQNLQCLILICSLSHSPAGAACKVDHAGIGFAGEGAGFPSLRRGGASNNLRLNGG